MRRKGEVGVHAWRLVYPRVLESAAGGEGRDGGHLRYNRSCGFAPDLAR